MGSERLDHQPPYRRRVNTVFQSYALFPHLTVEENVAYGLRVAKRPEAEIAQRVAEALDKVKMTAHAKSKPSKISGGQQQRVALRPRPREPSAPAPARRTTLRPGRQPAPPDAGRIEIAAARSRHRVRLRHARSGRSHGHVRPHRAPAFRRTRTGGDSRGKFTAARPPPMSPSSSATPIFLRLKFAAELCTARACHGQLPFPTARRSSLCVPSMFVWRMFAGASRRWKCRSGQ